MRLAGEKLETRDCPSPLVAIVGVLLMAAWASAQCGPGGCPAPYGWQSAGVGIGVGVYRQQVPPYSRPRYDPPPLRRSEPQQPITSPGVARVEITDCSGQQFVGTGCVVQGRANLLILTCGHNLRGAATVTAHFAAYSVRCSVIATSEAEELSLLDTGIAAEPQHRVYVPGRSDPQPGTTGQFYGLGGGYHVTRCMFIDIGRAKSDSGRPWLRLSPPCVQGDSGGPVTDGQCALVGVVWGHDGTYTYATPISTVWELFGEYLYGGAPAQNGSQQQAPIDQPAAYDLRAEFQALNAEFGELRAEILALKIQPGPEGKQGPPGPPGPAGPAGPAPTTAQLVPIIRSEVAQQIPGAVAKEVERHLAAIPQAEPYVPDYDRIAAEVQRRLPPIYLRQVEIDANKQEIPSTAQVEAVHLGEGYTFRKHKATSQ